MEFERGNIWSHSTHSSLVVPFKAYNIELVFRAPRPLSESSSSVCCPALEIDIILKCCPSLLASTQLDPLLFLKCDNDACRVIKWVNCTCDGYLLPLHFQFQSCAQACSKITRSISVLNLKLRKFSVQLHVRCLTSNYNFTIRCNSKILFEYVNSQTSYTNVLYKCQINLFIISLIWTI